ncbi:hypothetical protein QYH69_29485 [Paraburkholderia sp. SARCC-3016]|uniref:hypothetical protein n=1 Tax=Paraburkholderia sp. SARCC-3016 TaxID=3058611 RepID=UPI0028081F5D|nr:hypothetical protein [Paraburkholderia sp. SARCC-3016]MDQ7981369.1 hypothetical protein [Paraburkholderia sp. SARCC-3016]
MKRKTRTYRGIERTEGETSNILRFPTPETHNVAARQQLVRSKLADLIRVSERASPVALALAAVLPDGSVEFSATAIEQEFAEPVADALDRLSTTLRFHAASTQRTNLSQRGSAALAPLISLAFMAATYVNEIAWLDSALMLLGQVAIGIALNRTRSRRR